jgi:uncharacterized membrane protein
MAILFALLGVATGLVLDRHGGWLYGGLAGLCLGLLISMRDRVKRLEHELARLRESAPVGTTVEAPSKPLPAVSSPPPADEGEAADHAWAPSPNGLAVGSRTGPWGALEPADEKRSQSPVSGPAPVWRPMIDWLTGGNLMVRVGVVVLFFGMAFLLKFAAEHALLPIELRLAGVGMGGIAMLLVGWRLRVHKRVYGLVLQGGAVGVLYLTVFAALRLYALLPPGLAFGVLLVFSVFSAALAVLQDARSLAVLAAAGGFLAPILTSTGAGSHVQLFSYYLVLDLGILGIAWFRAWRMLNLVGFAFTFVIGTAWGTQYYQPAYFTTTEPFLIAFTLVYVAVAVLFALRQPPRLRGYVDGTLVFGVPLVAFALQAALVREMAYGLAWSALAAAAFYVLLARALFTRLGSDARLAAEAFLAIGVVFATLAVPLALDARWTAGMWALEGAAMVWVGRRQGRLLPRTFGYLLQLGAGLSFLRAAEQAPAQLPVLNGLFVGTLVIATAGLFTAWYLARWRKGLRGAWEPKVAPLALTWGLIWWYGGWLFEIVSQVGEGRWVLSVLVFASASAATARWLQGRLGWPGMRFPARSTLGFGFVMLPAAAVLQDHPFEDLSWLGWLSVLGAHLFGLYRDEREGQAPLFWLHGPGLWLMTILLTWEVAWWLDESIRGADTWWRIALGLVPAGVLVSIRRWGGGLPWPVGAHPDLYREPSLLPAGGYLWAWVWVLVLASKGAADPLPYVPLLNPMDIAVGLVLGALLTWVRPGEQRGGWRFGLAPWLYLATVFLWLNSVWLRTAHHWLGVYFSPEAMFQSQIVQAGIALLWGLCGLVAMVTGTRSRRRALWLGGAALMGVVVAKLFLVDLSNTGTMARIVSFITVGLLLLVVGYFSPVPPKQHSEAVSE